MLKYEVMVKNGFWRMKERAKEAVRNFLLDEEGDTNMISIVIILVIVIGLAALFRKNIVDFVVKLWDGIMNDAETATSPLGGN